MTSLVTSQRIDRSSVYYYEKKNSGQGLAKDSLNFVLRSSTPETNDNSSDSERESCYTPHKKTFSSDSIEDISEQHFEIDVCPKRKKFSNLEEKRQHIEDYKRKYKTELCKNWELRGTCKFGDKCCFAHGKNELKSKLVTHLKFKTKPCKQYFQVGYCPYGQRCQYLHREALSPNIFDCGEQAYDIDYFELYEDLHEVNRLCGTDAPLSGVLNLLPNRERLPAFSKFNNDF